VKRLVVNIPERANAQNVKKRPPPAREKFYSAEEKNRGDLGATAENRDRSGIKSSQSKIAAILLARKRSDGDIFFSSDTKRHI
jgi:hypothetical protein